jgi:hypothetical protein
VTYRRQYDTTLPPDFTTVRPNGQRRKFIGFRNQWDNGQIEQRYQEVSRVKFYGSHLDEEVWLDVLCFAEFLRDVRHLCAFCHGDPCGERSAPDSLIMREIAAAPTYAPFETCPCCEGRPS